MARQGIVENNKKKIKLVKKFMLRRNSLKSKVYNKSLSLEQRFNYVMRLSALPKNSSKVRIRNRCNITGRARGVYRLFGLSRSKIREFFGLGFLSGVIKSSW